MSENGNKWRFAVDRGGTFTDVIGLDPEGNYHTHKLLSVSNHYKDASIEGIRRVLGLKSEEPLPEEKIEEIRFGTTVATNALLERKGGKIALLITKGFRDLLEIGYQDRPDIFSLCIKKTKPLYSEIIEVDERTDSSGNIIKEIDIVSLIKALEGLKDKNIDSIAVVLMHSWIDPSNELACLDTLNDQGYQNIFLSHQAVNQIKIVSRGQSTLVDAYLSTVLSSYINDIRGATGSVPIKFMQSNGILSTPDDFKGKSALLSGPAGGAIAVAEVARANRLKGVIGFDMGGTSTDVSRFDEKIDRVFEHKIAGIPLQTEMLDIITVAAGGGSILSFDGRKMTVGPESAGSAPGPACYGLGGPLTVTDANLITGRIIPEFFPKTFGKNGNTGLDIDIVRAKFTALTEKINTAMRTEYSPEEAALGFLRIADEKMAMAIKEISVSRGFDIRDYALISFGGAGGQHACSIAKLLDIRKIIIHPLSSLMSAYGIGLSKPAKRSVKTVLQDYNEDANDSLAGTFAEMESTLIGSSGIGTSYKKLLEIDLRPKGSESFITLPYDSYNSIVTAFDKAYKKLYGFTPDISNLEVVNLRTALEETSDFFVKYHPGKETAEALHTAVLEKEIYLQEGSFNAPVYSINSLNKAGTVYGLAVIIESNSTIIVDPDFEAMLDNSGQLILTRISAEKRKESRLHSKPDPVLLEVFNNIFMGIATEMGITLKNISHSVNMKERLDFSCAVFDSTGYLVANAPHIPVHLGSMADTVMSLIDEKRSEMRPGDVFLTNDPYSGGSHLPDMTAICPVFSDKGDIIFFTAARGHHSDVGGTTPGSMPPSASHIEEEGVLLHNFLLLHGGEFRKMELSRLFSGHKYPVRNIPERISDLKAQIAACHKGMNELNGIIKRYGIETVSGYMGHIQDNAEYSVKNALFNIIDRKEKFSSSFEDHMDDGSPLKVKLSIKSGDGPPETLRAVIDFSGTGSQHTDDNLNAPLSVTRSAVMYVLRLLINSDIPLNSGCLKPVDIIVPDDSLLNPSYPAPVSSGNVETSQRIVDVLLGALGIAAASQGTMNNLLFEVEGEVPYYETIAGGSGAAEGCNGASGVQVHMTNTRMTDPEILEHRHPGIRLERFTLRSGSGGTGKYRGGEGVTREIRFLKPATVSILSERRVKAPYGLEGGKPGGEGINRHKDKDGNIIEIGHRSVLKLNKDESIIIETPGGGGYGEK